MNTQMLRRVRRLFNNEFAPRHIRRHNMRQWVRSVRHLGDEWVLRKHQERVL